LRLIGPSAVVGHSLGGGLVLKTAEVAGELVQAVVLLAPAASSLAAARAMGVAPTMLGADWGLPGHVFIVERQSEIVAARTVEWLSGVEGP
jgi:pimeloyl-ACP methyl ester carboxylesterase